MLLPNISDSQMDEVSTAILENLEYPIVFSKQLRAENGYTEFRLIVDADENKKGVLTFHPKDNTRN